MVLTCGTTHALMQVHLRPLLTWVCMLVLRQPEGCCNAHTHDVLRPLLCRGLVSLEVRSHDSYSGAWHMPPLASPAARTKCLPGAASPSAAGGIGTAYYAQAWWLTGDGT